MKNLPIIFAFCLVQIILLTLLLLYFFHLKERSAFDLFHARGMFLG